MIVKNFRIEPVDTDFRSDGILLFDFERNTLLQKIAFRIFSFFGSPVRSREFLIKEKLNDNDIVRYIYDQQSVLQEFGRTTPRYLILGHDAMQELKMRTTYGAFTVGENFSESYTNKRFGGLKVVLMPSMSGVLVLPDFCEEEAREQGSSVPPVSGVGRI